MLVSDVLWHNETARPHKDAIICGDQRLTFAQLGDRTRRLASALIGLGIRPSERVAVLATNCAEYVEIVFAVAAIGAVWVPLNHRLTPAELTYILQHSAASAVIFTSDRAENAEAARASSDCVRLWISITDRFSGCESYEELLAAARPGRLPVSNQNELFTIMYTSGTTGRPKGVMLTNHQFIRGTTYLALAFGAKTQDVALQASPQWHAGGQQVQLAHFMVGATTVIMRKFDPDLLLSHIDEDGITAVGIVPTMLTALLETPQLGTTKFRSLERIMYGGSPIAEDRLALALDRFNASFFQFYGQTEAGVLCTVLDHNDHLIGLHERPEVLRSCGRQMFGSTVQVLDGVENRAAPNEPGELVVTSESVMTGYWQNPEASTNALRNGRLHTGDIAYQDEDGRFYLVDRKIDLIVSGGENVYPIEIEHVISSHPDVLEVAVVGVPDDRWGEAVKAIVVLRAGRSVPSHTILSYCRTRLAGYKIPKSIEFAAGLPRNSMGKLLKNELRKSFWGDRVRQI